MQEARAPQPLRPARGRGEELPDFGVFPVGSVRGPKQSQASCCFRLTRDCSRAIGSWTDGVGGNAVPLINRREEKP
jgi:hypothetical protein